MYYLKEINDAIKEILLEKGGKVAILLSDEIGGSKILTKVDDCISSDELLEVIKGNLPVSARLSEYTIELIHEDKLFEKDIHELECDDFIDYVEFLELYYELTKDKI